VIGIHQCIKRDLPHEALQLYSKMKQLEPQGKVDTSVHSALLGLLVGELNKHGCFFSSCWCWVCCGVLYSKMKQLEPKGKVDTSVHSALLGLLVGE
jgi:hypothetical protein